MFPTSSSVRAVPSSPSLSIITGVGTGKSIPPDALVLAETPAQEATTGVLTKVKNGLAIAGKLPCARAPHLSVETGR
jgi:hypothetical protein